MDRATFTAKFKNLRSQKAQITRPNDVDLTQLAPLLLQVLDDQRSPLQITAQRRFSAV
jgi:hypothetical protein